ncbi:MAG: bifunctional 3,4-dihydroxy-2-butanone-4-phosphate synthase/GTP cyclohydrolase II [Armatimonadota bacterium]
MPFCSVEEAIREIRAGKMLVVVDSEDRENEGDLVMAAECITPEAINFMETHARGWVCVPLEGQRLDQLDLPLMVARGTARLGTAFTVTVDARYGTTTGISAKEQAHTIQVLLDPDTRPSDLLRPGHVRPLRAAPGGVLLRAGHTEAAVDLARMAGFQPAGVICEIKRTDGEMARVPELTEFAAEHDLKILTIADLIAYRRQTEKLVSREASCRLPTKFGEFVAHAYETTVDSKPYLALVLGEIDPEEPVLVRAHSGCVTGDILHSLKCDCGKQLHRALERIQREGRGVLLYLQGHEGRGIGLTNKIRAYALQDAGMDTVEANQHLGFPADMRDYGIGAQILYDLGVRKMRLMTNNPRKRSALHGYGLSVVEIVPLSGGVTEENQRYLQTKRDKLGHMLPTDLRVEAEDEAAGRLDA